MSALEFEAWPKIPRLNRGMLLTEKLDGTNAAVLIVPLADLYHVEFNGDSLAFRPDDARVILGVVDGYAIAAQSRTRFVTTDADNFGFAGWVQRNAATLVADLGAGRHFGEWWGAGIQRRYGLTGSDKRFSLFHVDRWAPGSLDETEVPSFTTEALGVVPALYRGAFDVGAIDYAVEDLRARGSVAVPGFLKPEGVVVWHYASRTSYKVTLEGDEAPKGPAGHAND